MYKLSVKEAEEPEIKFPTFVGSWRKQGNFRKTTISALLTMLKPLTVWIIKAGKFLKRREYSRSPYLSPKKPICSQKATVRTRLEEMYVINQQGCLCPIVDSGPLPLAGG